MEITIGRTVLYTLSAEDADQINRRRTNGTDIAVRIKNSTVKVADYKTDEPPLATWPIGAQAHIGNAVVEGEVYPLIVTRVWSPGCVNGQVLLDGNDAFWVTSATEGTGPRTWAWPIRA
jgi:hypothetical protein